MTIAITPATPVVYPSPEELAALLAEEPGTPIAVGSEIRLRRVLRSGIEVIPHGISVDVPIEQVVALVPKGEGGVYKLEPCTPLAKALLGRRAGDVVPVTVQATTVTYVVLAVRPAELT